MSAISFRSQSLMVFYIQVFLKEKYPDATYVDSTGTVKVLNSKRLKVTGVYDYVTYQVLACYMYSHFPNEKYPMESLWEEQPDGSRKYIGMQEFSGDIPINTVITDNIEACMIGHPEVMSIPERVQSYFLDEVVTKFSLPSEVFRVQKLLYYPNKMADLDAGVYKGTFEQIIRDVQQHFIDSHTYEVIDEETRLPTGETEVKLPSNFQGFKVTGYCDPWTEVLIENGNY